MHRVISANPPFTLVHSVPGDNDPSGTRDPRGHFSRIPVGPRGVEVLKVAHVDMSLPLIFFIIVG